MLQDPNSNTSSNLPKPLEGTEIRSNARGFHDPTSFITMFMLDRVGIAPELLWNQAK